MDLVREEIAYGAPLLSSPKEEKKIFKLKSRKLHTQDEVLIILSEHLS